MHALRSDRYKYIHYIGIWDTDELYDLEKDTIEAVNLALQPQYQPIVNQMKEELFRQLAATQGMYIPLQPDRGNPNNLRNEDGSPAAAFPSQWLRRQQPKP